MLFEIPVEGTEIAVTAATGRCRNFCAFCQQLCGSFNAITVQIFLEGHTHDGMKNCAEGGFGDGRPVDDLRKGDFLVEVIFNIFNAVHHKLSVFF